MDSGFALAELVVLVIGFVVLSGVLLPAAFRVSSSSSVAVRCLNNHKQLVQAWVLYAEDNAGRLVPNYHGAPANGHATTPATWARGWLDWTTSGQNTNELLVGDPQYAQLARYFKGKSGLVKCPADRYVSAAQRARGWKARVRSVSLSLGLGAGNAISGPWDPIYKQALALGDLIIPSPAETFTFIDEQADSINDPAIFSPFRTSIIDLPAAYHNGAAGVGFADGHVRAQRWKEAMTARNAPVTTRGFRTVPMRVGDSDVAWMSYHSSRVATKFHQ